MFFNGTSWEVRKPMIVSTCFVLIAAWFVLVLAHGFYRASQEERLP